MQNFIAAFFFLFLFSSCSDHSKNDLKVFSIMNEGLSSSNERIRWQTEFSYKSLQNKLADPRTHEQAAKWEPKAEHIKQLSAAMTKYIEELKSDLIKEAGHQTKDDKSILSEKEVGSVNRFFEANKKGNELYQELVKFRTAILDIDVMMDKEFHNKIILTTGSFDKSKDQPLNFTRSFFTGIPLIAALAILEKIENNILIIENDLVTYCNVQVMYLDGY